MPTAQELDEILYLRDGVLPVGAVKPTSTGDWPTITGRPNLVGAHKRRAVVSQGELTHRPRYGGGLAQRVENIDSEAVRFLLMNTIRVNALRDPRVVSATVDVSTPDATVPGRVLVSLQLSTVGAELVTAPSFVVEV